MVLLGLTFLIPVKSNDKIKTGMALLVSFSVIYISLKDQIPETSSNVSIITVIMLLFMSMATFAITEAVLVTSLHYGGFQQLHMFLGNIRRRCRYGLFIRVQDTTVHNQALMLAEENYATETQSIRNGTASDVENPDGVTYSNLTDNAEGISHDPDTPLHLKIDYVCFIGFFFVAMFSMIFFLSWIHIHSELDFHRYVTQFRGVFDSTNGPCIEQMYPIP